MERIKLVPVAGGSSWVGPKPGGTGVYLASRPVSALSTVVAEADAGRPTVVAARMWSGDTARVDAGGAVSHTPPGAPSTSGLRPSPAASGPRSPLAATAASLAPSPTATPSSMVTPSPSPAKPRQLHRSRSVSPSRVYGGSASGLRGGSPLKSINLALAPDFNAMRTAPTPPTASSAARYHGIVPVSEFRPTEQARVVTAYRAPSGHPIATAITSIGTALPTGFADHTKAAAVEKAAREQAANDRRAARLRAQVRAAQALAQTVSQLLRSGVHSASTVRQAMQLTKIEGAVENRMLVLTCVHRMAERAAAIALAELMGGDGVGGAGDAAANLYFLRDSLASLLPPSTGGSEMRRLGYPTFMASLLPFDGAAMEGVEGKEVEVEEVEAWRALAASKAARQVVQHNLDVGATTSAVLYRFLSRKLPQALVSGHSGTSAAVLSSRDITEVRYHGSDAVEPGLTDATAAPPARGRGEQHHRLSLAELASLLPSFADLSATDRQLEMTVAVMDEEVLAAARRCGIAVPSASRLKAVASGRDAQVPGEGGGADAMVDAGGASSSAPDDGDMDVFLAWWGSPQAHHLRTAHLLRSMATVVADPDALARDVWRASRTDTAARATLLTDALEDADVLAAAKAAGIDVDAVLSGGDSQDARRRRNSSIITTLLVTEGSTSREVEGVSGRGEAVDDNGAEGGHAGLVRSGRRSSASTPAHDHTGRRATTPPLRSGRGRRSTAIPAGGLVLPVQGGAALVEGGVLELPSSTPKQPAPHSIAGASRSPTWSTPLSRTARSRRSSLPESRARSGGSGPITSTARSGTKGSARTSARGEGGMDGTARPRSGRMEGDGLVGGVDGAVEGGSGDGHGPRSARPSTSRRGRRASAPDAGALNENDAAVADAVRRFRDWFESDSVGEASRVRTAFLLKAMRRGATDLATAVIAEQVGILAEDLDQHQPEVDAVAQGGGDDGGGQVEEGGDDAPGHGGDDDGGEMGGTDVSRRGSIDKASRPASATTAVAATAAAVAAAVAVGATTTAPATTAVPVDLSMLLSGGSVTMAQRQMRMAYRRLSRERLPQMVEPGALGTSMQPRRSQLLSSTSPAPASSASDAGSDDAHQTGATSPASMAQVESDSDDDSLQGGVGSNSDGSSVSPSSSYFSSDGHVLHKVPSWMTSTSGGGGGGGGGDVDNSWWADSPSAARAATFLRQPPLPASSFRSLVTASSLSSSPSVHTASGGEDEAVMVATPRPIRAIGSRLRLRATAIATSEGKRRRGSMAALNRTVEYANKVVEEAESHARVLMVAAELAAAKESRQAAERSHNEVEAAATADDGEMSDIDEPSPDASRLLLLEDMALPSTTPGRHVPGADVPQLQRHPRRRVSQYGRPRHMYVFTHPPADSDSALWMVDRVPPDAGTGLLERRASLLDMRWAATLGYDIVMAYKRCGRAAVQAAVARQERLRWNKLTSEQRTIAQGRQVMVKDELARRKREDEERGGDPGHMTVAERMARCRRTAQWVRAAWPAFRRRMEVLQAWREALEAEHADLVRLKAVTAAKAARVAAAGAREMQERRQQAVAEGMMMKWEDARSRALETAEAQAAAARAALDRAAHDPFQPYFDDADWAAGEVMRNGVPVPLDTRLYLTTPPVGSGGGMAGRKVSGLPQVSGTWRATTSNTAVARRPLQTSPSAPHLHHRGGGAGDEGVVGGIGRGTMAHGASQVNRRPWTDQPAGVGMARRAGACSSTTALPHRTHVGSLTLSSSSLPPAAGMPHASTTTTTPAAGGDAVLAGSSPGVRDNPPGSIPRLHLPPLLADQVAAVASGLFGGGKGVGPPTTTGRSTARSSVWEPALSFPYYATGMTEEYRALVGMPTLGGHGSGIVDLTRTTSARVPSHTTSPTPIDDASRVTSAPDARMHGPLPTAAAPGSRGATMSPAIRKVAAPQPASAVLAPAVAAGGVSLRIVAKGGGSHATPMADWSAGLGVDGHRPTSTGRPAVRAPASTTHHRASSASDLWHMTGTGAALGHLPPPPTVHVSTRHSLAQAAPLLPPGITLLLAHGTRHATLHKL